MYWRTMRQDLLLLEAVIIDIGLSDTKLFKNSTSILVYCAGEPALRVSTAPLTSHQLVGYDPVSCLCCSKR